MVYHSQEEREAYREKMRREAEQRIETLANSWQDDPKQLAEYLQFASRFHRYSPRNQMLIYSQNPTASFVASFKDFKDMGYFIRKGEHGMQILAPAPTTFWRKTPQHPWRRLTDATDDEKLQVKIGMYESREQMRYKVGTVFDITQTTCPIEDYPKLLGLGYNDEQHAAIYQVLSAYSGTLGMPVTEKPLEMGLRGAFYHADHHIEINSNLGDTQKLSTLLHEMSHGIMEHDTAPGFSVSLKELEADALSIMLEDRFGIDITEARQQHLSEHFHAYLNELTQKELEFDPADTFKRVHDRYEKCEAAMARCLEQQGVLPQQSPVTLTAEPPLETPLVPAQEYPSAELMRDHFYVDRDIPKIDWLYYNPDSDHFVSTLVYDPDFEDALQVAAEGGGTSWDVLETQGKQYILERGTEEYAAAWERMMNEEPFAQDRTQESFERLQHEFDTIREQTVEQQIEKVRQSEQSAEQQHEQTRHAELNAEQQAEKADQAEQIQREETLREHRQSEIASQAEQKQMPEKVDWLVGAQPDSEKITQKEFDDRWARGQRDYKNIEFYEIQMPQELKNARFENCSFYGCNFENANISAAYRNCAMYEPKTGFTAFQDSSFENSKIGWASFRDSSFENVAFRNTDFQKCNAMRTSFADVNFDGGSMDRFHFYNKISAERVSGLESMWLGIRGESEKVSKQHAKKIYNALEPAQSISQRELDLFAAEQKMPMSTDDYACAIRWMADANRDQLPDVELPSFVKDNPTAEDTYKLASAIVRANDPDLAPELQQLEASGLTHVMLQRAGITTDSLELKSGKLTPQMKQKLMQHIRNGAGVMQNQVNGRVQGQGQSQGQNQGQGQALGALIDPGT